MVGNLQMIKIYMKPIQQHENEMSVGSCVVIPPPGHIKVIDELNAGVILVFHKMKSLAWSYVWWSGMDADLESKIKTVNSISRTRSLYQLY